MAITPEQARAELARRELERRGSVPEEKGMIRKAAEAVIDSPALPIIGGTIGALAGAGAGSIPLAALGGSGGEAFRQLGARALGMDAPETSLEAAKDIGIEGGTQAAGQAIGLGIGKAAGAVAKIPVVKGAIEGTKKTLGDMFQIITKIKPRDAATLFENPEAILPGAWEKAQVAWRKAAKAAGISVDDVSPEIIEALKKDAKSTVYETFEKIRSGGPVTAGEAQTAKQALDIALMPAAKTERNKPLVALYGKMRDQFVKRLGEESPELAAANKEYAIAKAGKRFRSIFPRNLDDSPAYFRSSVLPSLFTGAGAFRGDPLEGAMQGAGVAAASSPLAIGSLIALAGGARGLAPYARTSLTAALAELASQRFKRK